jgi:multidrug efflux pump subunit AcrA (membrane-fusion protein)
VPQIRLGGPVEVRVPALNRSFPGKVARFVDKVDSATRTMKTEVDVPNPNLVLIPGMYAEVDLTTEQHRDALAVPVEAVAVVSGAARVMTVTSSGTIRVVPIVTGIETAQQIEIKSGDVKEGDRVVIGSRAGLKDGDSVRAKF